MCVYRYKTFQPEDCISMFCWCEYRHIEDTGGWLVRIYDKRSRLNRLIGRLMYLCVKLKLFLRLHQNPL